MSTRTTTQLLVLGQAVAALVALMLFLLPGFTSNVVGWLIGAFVVSSLFAAKNQLTLAQGIRAIHYVGLNRAASLLLAVGMGAAFVHAFFVATELAK